MLLSSLSHGVEESVAAGRVFGKAGAQTPQPVVDCTDDGPRLGPVGVEVACTDERREESTDGGGILGVIEPSPHQLGTGVFGVSGDSPRVNGQPGLAGSGQDVCVMQVGVD